LILVSWRWHATAEAGAVVVVVDLEEAAGAEEGEVVASQHRTLPLLVVADGDAGRHVFFFRCRRLTLESHDT
jgi:hypothetical protein